MPNTPIQDTTLAQLRDALDQAKAIAAAATENDIYEAANESQASIQERISTLLNLQLAGDTAQMQAQAAEVTATKGAFDTAAKNLTTANDIVTATADFLDAVDVLIKVASHLA
jgi:transaldolase